MPGTNKHLLATSIRVVKRENMFSLRRGWGGRNKAGFLSSSRVQMGEACRVSFSRSFGSCLRSCPLKTPALLLSSLLAKEPRGNVSPGPPPPSLGFQCPTSPSHLSSPMSLSLGLLLASDQLICAKMLITLGLNQLSLDLKKNISTMCMKYIIIPHEQRCPSLPCNSSSLWEGEVYPEKQPLDSGGQGLTLVPQVPENHRRYGSQNPRLHK